MTSSCFSVPLQHYRPRVSFYILSDIAAISRFLKTAVYDFAATSLIDSLSVSLTEPGCTTARHFAAPLTVVNLDVQLTTAEADVHWTMQYSLHRPHFSTKKRSQSLNPAKASPSECR